MTNDDVDLAIAAWKAGDDSMMEFCIKAAGVVGKNIEGETKRLAKGIRRSVDTVERYAKAGLLWWAICGEYPADSELVREALDYQYWVALGTLWSKNVISLAGAWHWLDEAVQNKWEYEKFLSMLPKAKVMDSDWQKNARRAAEMLDDLCASPAFDVDAVKYKTVLKVLKVASVLLKGLTMSNIVERLVEEKIAQNNWQAANIANGLELFRCKDDDERMKRARLYRDWRDSQAFPKSDTKSCFAKAIAGEAAPAPLIAEAAHSEVEDA